MERASFYVALAKTLDGLQREVEEVLKSHGLSEPQYNVLCVLRAAHPTALSCGDIAAGMISRDPDITRLLDRLERCGYIERRRGSPDRRLVSVNILEPGIELVDRLRETLDMLHARQFSALAEDEIETLSEKLSRVHKRLQGFPSMTSPARAPVRLLKESSMALAGVG